MERGRKEWRDEGIDKGWKNRKKGGRKEGMEGGRREVLGNAHTYKHAHSYSHVQAHNF